MKHCPRCHGQYSDELAFCDVDGTPLVDEIATLHNAPRNRGPGGAVSAPPVVTVFIGILIGIVLCTLVYITFLTPRRNSSESPNQDRESTAISAAPTPQNLIAPAPSPSSSPAAEESPSPERSEESAEAVPPVATETPAGMATNQGPISTGTTTHGEGRTLITMKDGSSLEADAAWEDAEGVWYRRSGVVSYVERAKVEKISDLSSRNSPTEAKP